MDKEKIKVLIIGGGSIGLRHTRNVLEMGYKNVILCEKDRKKATSIAKELPITIYNTPKKALDNEKPTAVLICTPPHTHIPLALLSLNYQTHLFIEKPLSHSIKNIAALIRQGKQAKRVMMVACNYRFNKGWLKLHKIITTKKYGEPCYVFVRGSYYLPQARLHSNFKKTYAAKLAGGGVIFDSASHSVDYLTPLFGPIKTIRALKNKLHPLGIKNEEIAHLLFEHQNGVTTTLSFDYISKKSRHYISVITTFGEITLDLQKDTVIFEGQKGRKVLYQGNANLNQMFIDELRHFFHCIQKGIKPLQTLEDGRRILEILLKAKQKA